VDDPVAPATKQGAWKARPAGVPDGVPPPSVPLSFLGAAVLGLVACGVALVFARSVATIDPTDDRVVGAAHFMMLATLSMGVLGAIHQFTPVITQRSLRSVLVSRATFATWFAASWLLPLGFLTRQEAVVEAGGAFAALAVTLLVINIAPPLAARGKGAPTTGLRLAVIGLVATAGYGVVYVIDRRAAWFDLSGHVVLAHASVGLLAWLGLTYLSVSQKLWPMFMLAHVTGRRRADWVGVWALFAGVALLSPGLLFAMGPLALVGGLVVALGLGAHLYSLVRFVRHRRRVADLHLAYVTSSAGWLVVAAGLAVAGTLVIARHEHLGVALSSATITAVAGWLLVALVGHSYKIVPFIVWSALRSRGVAKKPDGTQLMFADLYSHRWSRIDFVFVNAAVAAICVGLGVSDSALIGVGGVLLVACALITAGNLSWRPVRLLRTAHAQTPQVATALTLPAELGPRRTPSTH